MNKHFEIIRHGEMISTKENYNIDKKLVLN